MAPDKNFDKRRLKLYIGLIERAGPTITVAEMFEGHAKASQEWAKKVVETVPFAERGPKHDPCPVCGDLNDFETKDGDSNCVSGTETVVP